jgi:hypothetical protein
MTPKEIESTLKALAEGIVEDLLGCDAFNELVTALMASQSDYHFAGEIVHDWIEAGVKPADEGEDALSAMSTVFATMVAQHILARAANQLYFPEAEIGTA